MSQTISLHRCAAALQIALHGLSDQFDIESVASISAPAVEDSDDEGTTIEHKSIAKKRGRPAKTKENRLKPYLADIHSPRHALRTLPGFDNIVTGAVNLDFDGNTRPLSKKLMITLLERLDTISSKAVREYMHSTLRQCSVRHSQKIVQCLLIIEHAAMKVAISDWPSPDNADGHPSGNSTNYVTSCGDGNCMICGVRSHAVHTPQSSHAQEDHEDILFQQAENEWLTE